MWLKKIILKNKINREIIEQVVKEEVAKSNIDISIKEKDLIKREIQLKNKTKQLEDIEKIKIINKFEIIKKENELKEELSKNERLMNDENDEYFAKINQIKHTLTFFSWLRKEQ